MNIKTIKELKEERLLEMMKEYEIFRKSEAKFLEEKIEAELLEAKKYIINYFINTRYLNAEDACGYHADFKEFLLDLYLNDDRIEEEVIKIIEDMKTLKLECITDKIYLYDDSWLSIDDTIAWEFVDNMCIYKQDCNDILSDYLGEEIKSYRYAEELLEFAKGAEENFGCNYELNRLACYALALDLGII